MIRTKLGNIVLLAISAIAVVFVAPLTAQEPNFGRAIAMTPTDLVIGQPVNWYGPGTVYAYRASQEGWEEPQLLTAPDSSRMDDFGHAIAVDGNTMAIGTPWKHDQAGAVYVFTRPTTDSPWAITATIMPPVSESFGQMGTALALRGNELLVGAPTAGGGVYHYRRSSGTWSLETTITAGGEVDGFGTALAWGGGDLLVGAPISDDGRGRVYVVSLLENGGWGEAGQVELIGIANNENARAGTSITLATGHALVGAPGTASVAVLHVSDEGAWSHTETLDVPEEAVGSQFGFSLGLVGDELWVGAPGMHRRNGRVFRFTSSHDGNWDSPQRLDPDDTSGASWPLGFGYSVASSGDRAVVSMPNRDFGEGRVMTLSRGTSGWSADEVLAGEIYRIGSALEQGDRCDGGQMTEFPCANMELVSHMTVDDLGGERGVWVNDVWGWTDPESGSRYALVARRDGASFVDVTDASAPRLVGNLPRTVGSPPSVWRDIKVIGEHAYVVSDGALAHGMQVFDLTRLRDVGEEPVDFEPDMTYREIFSAHNVVADTESKFLYIVAANSGGRTCGG
ncbi:MAG TPA: choice-of-anchor B family protein, partial [Gemmatimonadetes bacterium]|nr:choice-of-anchor B family protein [Gemmatimonadota bacterium]